MTSEQSYYFHPDDSKDEFYNCESDDFTSFLEEIPNKEKYPYKLTITSKKTNEKSVKILDVRPMMSRIKSCNHLYTVVSYPCGGPCYADVFIFNGENRKIEEFFYVQEVKNNLNIIGHIENEEFEKLIVHNFANGKNMTIDVSDNSISNYGHIDSMSVIKNDLILHYTSEDEKYKSKTVSVKKIL